MNLSVRWLKKFLHEDLPIDHLLEILTFAGLEVESAIDLGMESGRIVVAKILEAEQHPNADKLKLCKVDDGSGEPLQIVCGAPNAEAGGLYPLARVGAVLPDGFEIKKGKIRGETSMGMLCSAKELGLGADHTGILRLPDKGYKAGEPFDFIVDIKVTPNRPDCLSVFGVARDVAGMLGKKIYPPTARFKEMLEHIDGHVRLAVKDRAGCPRYSCRLIKGVVVGESPDWLKLALMTSGLRPINSVVDVTNYVLMELGHPLHAFDFDRLHGGQVVVRLAKDKEKLTIIDGTELELDAEDLVIADERNPVALAGVMGGLHSEVTKDTIDVLLESAYFDPVYVRRTARRHGISTDASYRFERGTDRERLIAALDRAAQLVQEVAGGEIIKGCLDSQGTTVVEPILIPLEIKRVNNLLGLKLSSTEIADYLVNLDFEIIRAERELMLVQVPSHRVDVTRDVDLIEEVARLHNYNNIPVTLPPIAMSAAQGSLLETLEEVTRDTLAGLGFSEAINYSFIGESSAAKLGFNPDVQPHLANPLTVDQSIMRPSLLPGLMKNVAMNQKQDEPEIALFEIGKIWMPGARAGRIEGERRELALALTGPTPRHWSSGERLSDFYDIKGAIEQLVDNFGRCSQTTQLTFVAPGDEAALHPGRSARVLWQGEPIGAVGEAHPDIAEAWELRGRVYLAWLDLESIASIHQKLKYEFHTIPKFPASWRDLALVVDRKTTAAEVLETVRAAGGALLEDLELFDVYEGEHMASDKKSIALRLRLRSLEDTLKEEDIQSVVDRVLKKLQKQLGAELRS